MRILLDRNTPVGVRRILATHYARNAFQMGWARLSNSDLLDAAERAGFEILITSDRNMTFQQNLAGRTVAVVVLSTNFWPTIRSQPHRPKRRCERLSRNLRGRHIQPRSPILTGATAGCTRPTC